MGSWIGDWESALGFLGSEIFLTLQIGRSMGIVTLGDMVVSSGHADYVKSIGNERLYIRIIQALWNYLHISFEFHFYLR